MRITIHIRSGPHQGRRYALNPGQQLRFGRTDQSDVSFPDDDQLSSTHFLLAVDQSTCRLTDLDSTNGTSVNDEPVQACVLRNRDLIRAGGITFEVQLECAEDNDSAPGQDETAPPPQTNPAPSKIPSANKVTTTEPLNIETCPSGLLRASGSCELLRPTDLVNQLSAKVPLYLVIDPHRANISKAEIKSGEYVLDWLDPLAAAQMSPLFVPADEHSTALLEAAWGADAIVCIFSTVAPGELLEKLRQLAKPKSEQAGMLGVCWPQVLSHLLAAQTSLSEQLTSFANAYLVEDPTDPESWQLYGTESLPILLEQIGLMTQMREPQETETAT